MTRVEDFLLAEYSNLNNSLSESEELGNTRLNYFLTLTTAIISGSGIAKILSPNTGTDLTLVLGLFTLFFYGLVTFSRLIHRNITTDSYKRRLNTLREYFVRNDETILNFLPYNPLMFSELRGDKWPKFYSVGSGGLVQTAALLNSFILVSIVGIFLSSSQASIPIFRSPFIIFIIMFFVGILSWVTQWIYTHYRYRKAWRKREDEETQELLRAYTQSKTMSEIESSLLINSQIMQNIVNELTASISGLKCLTEYKKESGGEHEIHDVYFDTENCDLQREEFALRVRKIDNKLDKITLKGRSANTGLYQRRFEFEEIFSYTSIRKIINLLKEWKIDVFVRHEVNPNFDAYRILDPEEAMENVIKNLKLYPVQRRVTTRHILNIRSKVDELLLEIAIDHVVYNFNKRVVGFYEVEIEHKGQADYNLLQNVVRQLLKIVPSLKQWRFNKFPTGKAIQILDREERLDGYIDVRNDLKYEAFTEIERILNDEKLRLTSEQRQLK